MKSFSENGLTKDDNPHLHTRLKKILDGDLSENADEVESQDSELDSRDDSDGYNDKGEGRSQDSGEGQGIQEDMDEGSKRKARAKLFQDSGSDSSFYGFDRL